MLGTWCGSDCISSWVHLFTLESVSEGGSKREQSQSETIFY